jgi:hypothetical protein
MIEGVREQGRGLGTMSRRAAAWLAWSLSGLAAVLGGLGLFLMILNQADPEVSAYEYWGADTVFAVVFPMVSALIVSRHPANAVGWLLCIIGLSAGASRFSSEYASYVLLTEPGSLPVGMAAAWVGSWVGDIALFLFLAFVPLPFPDGRPPSRRWWPIVWLAAGFIALWTISKALTPGPLEGNPSIMNPFGIERAGALELVLQCQLQSMTSPPEHPNYPGPETFPEPLTVATVDRSPWPELLFG